MITDCDAFGDVYSECGGLMVPRTTGRMWTDEFLEATLKLLGNRDEIEARREQVKEFVKPFDWKIVTKQWMALVDKRLEEKRACVS